MARLATADERGRPHVVPICFAVDGDRLYSAVDHKPKRGPDLRRLDNLRANPVASVLVDHYEEDWDRLWWVRADGLATIQDDPDCIPGLRELFAERYPQYRRQPPGGPVIRIAIRHWTGWSAT